MSNSTDPVILSAQARGVAENLHKRADIVVRFKTNESGFSEDALTEQDEANPGHFQADKNYLTINLDAVAKGKRIVKLDSLEDFRQFPVLAGVLAHESGRARWSSWTNRGELPEEIPNPEFDAFNPTRTETTVDDDGNEVTTEIAVPESFKVSGNGKLIELAEFLEEPRVERLGTNVFTKTWKKALALSAGHLILEQVDKMDEEGENALDSAVKMAVLVGGRQTAGTLGATHESRQSIRKVLESAQKIIEEALPDVEDPYHQIMGIVNAEVFNNDHEDATSHLEAARQILKIVHPESAEDPDNNPEGPEGEGEEGSEDGGMGAGAGAMAAMQEAMREGVDDLGAAVDKLVKSEEENPGGADDSMGHGSTLFKNPNAPQIDHYEDPTADDRELYRRAVEWMAAQIEPTVTETEYGQWLPVGGARLDIRSMIRDDLAGHRGSQRGDWNQVQETVHPAPPVKVAIMLDGSGSMHAFARPSASIAWAAANAAAALPEARTVSVVYGDAAQVTQQPGHEPARKVAVSNTDGGTEEFIGAAKMVEDALWLDDPTEDGDKSNVLVIIVSDLHYYGTHRHPNGKTESQLDGFKRIVTDWNERGYKVVVVGASRGSESRAPGQFTIVEPKDLFR